MTTELCPVCNSQLDYVADGPGTLETPPNYGFMCNTCGFFYHEDDLEMIREERREKITYEVGDWVYVLPDIGVGKVYRIRAGSLEPKQDPRPLYTIELRRQLPNGSHLFYTRGDELKQLKYQYGEDQLAETIVYKLTMAEAFALASVPQPEIMIQAIAQAASRMYGVQFDQMIQESLKVS